MFSVLWCLGFCCCGILAGSCAASTQSSIGNVEAGSCFACAQSAGAGGQCGCCCGMIIISVIFGIALAITYDLNMFTWCKKYKAEDKTVFLIK